MYKIIDKQGNGDLESWRFKTKEKMREYLISYHSVDWEEESDINKMSLNDILEYGDWATHKIDETAKLITSGDGYLFVVAKGKRSRGWYVSSLEQAFYKPLVI